MVVALRQVEHHEGPVAGGEQRSKVSGTPIGCPITHHASRITHHASRITHPIIHLKNPRNITFYILKPS